MYDDFMGQALLEAQCAYRHDDVPVGAVIVLNGRIISRGHNTMKSQCDATAHAEINAIRQACTTLKCQFLYDCTLYVTLEPCMMCAGAIGHARLKKVVFGAYDTKNGHIEHNSKLENINMFHYESIGGIKAQDSEKLLATFFEQRRSIRKCDP